MTELPKDWDTCSRVVISARVQLWINNCVKINIYPVQVSCPCPSTALPQTWQLLHHCHFSGYCFYYCYYCICFTVWVDWLVSFGLEQDGGGLISPMALAHPLHPIDSRSRNRCRNLWVGWYIHTYICILYMSSIIRYIYIHIYIYIYIYIYIFTTGLSFSIGEAAPHHILQGYFGGVRGSWIECHFLFSLVYQLYLALW